MVGRLGLRDRFSFMRGNIAVLTVTQVLGRFFRSMVMPYASLYVLALGGESSQIGIINSLRPLAGLVMFPLAGYFTDRAGRKKLIGIAGYLSAATMMLYVFAPSWEWIALAAFLQGFMVIMFPPTSAIMADSLAPENRGIGVATMNTLASVLGMFSPYIAAILIQICGTAPGMRILYALLAGAVALGATINLRFLKETASEVDKGPSMSVSQIFRDAYGGIPAMLRRLPGSVRALGIVVILGFMANGVATSFWVIYAVEEIGLSTVNWGLILFIEAALKAIIYIPAGVLVDRYGRTRSLMASLLVSLVSIPTFVFARGFYQVLAIRLAVGVANVLFIPACSALMADCVPRDIRGRAMAALGRGTVLVGATGGGTGGPGMGFLITIPVMAASLAGGVLYAANPQYPWFFFLFTILVSIAVTALYVRDPKTAEI
jgi:MFS family permease